jgi:hypothetical protein
MTRVNLQKVPGIDQHNRRMLEAVGFDTAKMTKGQMSQAVKAVTGFTRECSDPNANRRRPPAAAALQQLYATAPTKRKRKRR